MQPLYPVIAETLKEDGVEAEVYGFKPNGYNVRIREGESRYTLYLAGGDIVITKQGGNLIIFQGPLADPDIFTKVKTWLKNSSSTSPSPSCS